MLALAASLVALATLVSPAWTLALLLAALPFATHHPSSAPTVLLIVLVTAFEIAYVIRARPSLRRAWHAVTGEPLLLLASLFTMAALLSLSSLPLASIWREHATAASRSPLSVWQHALDWLLLTEARREFSITSALLVVQGFVLALTVWREVRARGEVARRLSAALTLGMVIFICLGLLEAFGVVSLQPLRGAGGVILREGTLQSTSGNPGWFTQYLVYALPYCLVILAGTSAPGGRTAIVAVVTCLTLLALLVGFQRGGWLAGAGIASYVVLVSWYLVARSEQTRVTDRRQAWRVAALAAVGLALVTGGFSVWLSVSRPGAATFDPAAYLARFRSIGSADRLVYVEVGAKIAMLHPILGGGHESFAYRYSAYVDRPGGIYHRQPAHVPDPASAHNVFVQTAAGTGAVGLALLVAILSVAGATTVRALRTPAVDRGHLVTLLAAAGSLLGMACYGLVQEIFYVHALRLLFFVGIGLVAGVSGDVLRWPSRLPRALFIALIGAFSLHLVYEYVWPGPDRLLRSGEPTGLFAQEPGIGDARPFQWTTDWATWPLPLGATRFSLGIRTIAPYAQDIEIRPCRGPRLKVQLTNHAWQSVEGDLDGCAAGDHLEIVVSPTWSARGDARTLGVMVADVRFQPAGASP